MYGSTPYAVAPYAAEGTPLVKRGLVTLTDTAQNSVNISDTRQNSVTISDNNGGG